VAAGFLKIKTLPTLLIALSMAAIGCSIKCTYECIYGLPNPVPWILPSELARMLRDWWARESSKPWECECGRPPQEVWGPGLGRPGPIDASRTIVLPIYD